ncbi:MAG: glycosyltransferase [Paracoccaceae bacterium]
MEREETKVSPPTIVVGFATTGRAEVLNQTIDHLAKQTLQPDRIVVSAITKADFAGALSVDVPIEKITTGKGLTQQRNRILETLKRDEIVVFFDDDFVPCDDYLERVAAVYQDNPETVMVTGTVLADGILGLGLTFDDAVKIVTESDAPSAQTLTEVYNGYGCNMAFRGDVVVDQNIRFDENLPLYSWLEDVDFSRLLAPMGRLVIASDVRGVHLGVKSGRTSGVHLGYSQIVNPYYLIRKGTMSAKFGTRLALRNLAANCAKSFAPEPHIDRLGRVRGNLRGLKDIVLGKADPRKITDF